MAAFLKAQNEMKKQVKAGKTDWSDPEPSDEEDEDQDLGEISSDEDEPVGDREVTEKETQPEPTPPSSDPVSTHQGESEQPADSFEEAMAFPQPNEAGPSGTADGGEP